LHGVEWEDVYLGMTNLFGGSSQGLGDWSCHKFGMLVVESCQRNVVVNIERYSAVVEWES
jgi:hypothetical protein